MRCSSIWIRAGEVVLTIYPHGEIGFREPHKRAEYKLGLPDAFRVAVTITINKMTARVRELRKEGYGLADARRKARKELGI